MSTSTDSSTDVTTFSDLDLRPELLSALDDLGYEEPTPIQSESIPHLLQGRDVLGQAATGTGKTAAFSLPLLNRLQSGNRGKKPMGLILTPTRELAIQVSEATHKYGRALGARVLPVYGGQPIWRQLKALERGVDIVVATPGRALDHLNRGTLDLSDLEVVVLDEADEMMDMGFAEDLDAILNATPDDRQSVLFSATMPGRIEAIARKHMSDPVRITIDRKGPEPGSSPLIRQTAYVVARSHKAATLGRILDVEAPTAAIVFCRTRNEVDELTESMNGRGYRAEAIHGGLSQQQRDRVMDRLRSETAELLIATDVAARGLDIDHLTHVVNYDVPNAPESYVHRIGRVGRAGREGVAITLVEPRQSRMLKTIERHTGTKMEMEKVPTVADLRNRQIELTRSALQETLTEDAESLERFRGLVETMSDEHDLIEIAMAAVKLAHEASGNVEDQQELPTPTLNSKKDKGAGGPKGKGGAKFGGPTPGNITRLWVSAGRQSNIRPKDLVGAIANETSVSGKEIGAIQITQKFSLVEVPSGKADEVISALGQTTLKGRKVTVRRDQKN